MDDWMQISDYGWRHPDGWAIALMYSAGAPGYMLSLGIATHGPLESLWDAKARHAILAPHHRVCADVEDAVALEAAELVA